MRPLSASQGRLAEVVDCLVDDRTGIIRYVQDLPREAGAPEFFHFYAQACNTRAFSAQENFGHTGGASASRDVALAKAIGEAVERYSCALYELDELPLCARESAPFPCTDPAEFALYAPEQYRRPGFLFVPFDDATIIRWTSAVDPLDGSTCYVPASMVYMPYRYYLDTGDSPIMQPISTGLACHGGQAPAAISGVCEVIERDAFMITWQAKLAPPQILVETLDDANYDLVRRFEKAGAGVTLLNITTDVAVPVVLAVLQSPSPRAPALVFAASAGLNPADAVRKSLEELAHTRRYMQQITDLLPRLVTEPPGHENIVDQVTHLNYWCDHANAPQAEFLFASKARVEMGEIESLATGDPVADLEGLCSRVRAIGNRVLIADLTTEDVGDLGLTVIRALIPGFHPLQMGYGTRALGGQRLWNVPRILSHQGITPETGDNLSPHPYP